MEELQFDPVLNSEISPTAVFVMAIRRNVLQPIEQESVFNGEFRHDS
jgi:hypothetical protein